MSEIRIFMCCHKGYEYIPPLCEPIQCGTALNAEISGICHDRDGENISEKNREYCELTAHYYAWKNVAADYYGFCHYRRFFSTENSRRPYIVRGTLSESDKTRLLKDERFWRDIIQRHDIIAPKSEDMGLTVREHYCGSAHHFAEDLELFMQILSKQAPQLLPAAEKYLSQRKQYFCNMFVMKRELFSEYCGLLFGILEEFDKCKTLHGDFQSDRTDGYLGELFTGMFINFCSERGADIAELARLDVSCSAKKRIGYALLPPQSRRRFFAKRIVKKLRR